MVPSPKQGEAKHAISSSWSRMSVSPASSSATLPAADSFCRLTGQFDALLDAAEQLSEVFKNHVDELETMRKLNTELRQALLKTAASAEDQLEEELEEASVEAREVKKPSFLPFIRRPPGGFGDEEEEEEVEREVDDWTTEEGGDDPPRPSQAEASTTNPLSVTAHNTLRASSALLERLDTSTSPTASTRLGGNEPPTPISSTSPSPSTATASRPPPTPGVSRTPTLTFYEPSTPGVRDVGSTGSRMSGFSKKGRGKDMESGSG